MIVAARRSVRALVLLASFLLAASAPMRSAPPVVAGAEEAAPAVRWRRGGPGPGDGDVVRERGDHQYVSECLTEEPQRWAGGSTRYTRAVDKSAVPTEKSGGWGEEGHGKSTNR